MRRRPMLVAALASAALPCTSWAQSTLIAPSAEDVVLLYFALRNLDPPLAQWRAADPAIASSNEFQRAGTISAFDQRIATRLAALKGVRSLRVNVYGRFSGYDDANGCYYIEGVSDGSVIPFGAFGTQISVRAVNGADWTTWKLTPQQAEQVLRANLNDRSVLLQYALAIIDDQNAYPADREIAVDIKALDIQGSSNRVRLGSLRP